ncbi:hypothetical protein [Candidatus Methanocrinis natronophilus]|uniref:Uncharacterized protein n=1 Tax=Candidatus Methanocrinis natronophilus TaxID=3033396 RepID=A0ABT5XAI4_9EURY|nr:hypothetical protein [Candidatus Methanocrinis natronophilus]MDF0591681.1 hypothetical protein [Candidatus Methanocrinis natronophilus]
MLEIDGSEEVQAGRSGEFVRLGELSKIGRSMTIFFLLLAVISLSSAQVGYEPGEREVERLFELGLGRPWIISERHPEMYAPEVPTGPSTSEFSIYSEYFTMTPPSMTEVERHFVSGAPDIFAYGPGGEAMDAGYYQTYFYGGNSLWILGARSWTGYAVVPQGAYLRLLAHSPAGGWASLYEITPAERMVQKRFMLYSGYSVITFRAEEAGRYILLFSVGDEASNAVILDVRRGSWPVTYPAPGPQPPWRWISQGRFQFAEL